MDIGALRAANAEMLGMQMAITVENNKFQVLSKGIDSYAQNGQKAFK